MRHRSCRTKLAWDGEGDEMTATVDIELARRWRQLPLARWEDSDGNHWLHTTSATAGSASLRGRQRLRLLKLEGKAAADHRLHETMSRRRRIFGRGKRRVAKVAAARGKMRGIRVPE
ncbi:Os03g0145650 [Oryza sativa Japonica Group]|uniref:Uncharacterized protein n=2 Tax=Oryza sativa subsp. japonica TaxID=39947 RepID=A0A8J8XLG1_ORYSJ|nr:hypothetical protein OsJ_09392 [Oryza sativa Japonica Group]BAS82266.1 Os03g0145650 [Oryza sativa Japonica Group]